MSVTFTIIRAGGPRRALAALSLGAALACLTPALAQAQSGEATGVWTRAEGTSRIRISKCGDGLCGSLAWLREPNGPDGKPRTDSANPDESKRSRPLLGLPVVLNMKPTGTANQWKGSVYKADEGKTYTGYLTILGPRQLKLEGCVLGGMICKAETLNRYE